MEALKQASSASLFAVFISMLPMAFGIAYALRPDERRLGLMRPLTLAGIFAAVSTVLLGVANGLSAATADPAAATRFSDVAFGVAEGAVLAFAGFACLTVGWLAVAVGMARAR